MRLIIIICKFKLRYKNKNMKLSPKDIENMYNKSAWYYDLYSTSMWFGMHNKFREFIVNALNIEKKDVVLEIGCGTGLNFPFIMKKLGKNGRVIGIDISKKMLIKARSRIKRNGWDNITLIHGDFNNLEEEKYKMLQDENLTKISMVLIASVIPNYEEAILKSFNLLKNNGRFVIGDLKKLDQHGMGIDIYNKILESSSKKWGQDFSRKPWNFLKDLQNEGKISHYEFKQMIDIFYAAIGIK